MPCLCHALTRCTVGQILNTKTNMTQCGTEPTADNWDVCAKELIGYVKGNVTMVMDHPAVAGYYACDDCCHMPVLNEYGDIEYRMEAAVKKIIREVDPWRLMFGSIACGETWYWTEEGAGLAMDVMMKEGCERRHPHFIVWLSSLGCLGDNKHHYLDGFLLCCALVVCIHGTRRRHGRCIDMCNRLATLSQMLVQLGTVIRTLPNTGSFR